MYAGINPGRGVAVALALLLIVTAAAAGGVSRGKVKKGIYASPLGDFTVPVPSGLGMRVSDAFNKEAGIGAVSFHDDFASLDGIACMWLTPEGQAALADSTRHLVALEAWLRDFAMPTWFLPASPSSRLSHVAPGDFEGMRALLAVVEIPGGSPAMDLKTGRRLDSRRGLAIFRRGERIYMLFKETGGLLYTIRADSAAAASDSAWAAFVPSLGTFYRSMRFTAAD